MIIFALLVSIFLSNPATAGIDTNVVDGWNRRVSNELAKKDFDTRVVVESVEPATAESPAYVFIGEGAPGVVRFQKQGALAPETVDVRFREFKNVLRPRIAIAPGSALTPDLFEKAEIEVTRGMEHQLRNQIVSEDTDLSSYEAKWGLTKGQTLMDSQIAKIPLIRRGETVKLRVSTGDIFVLTTARAEQNASIGDVIKVTALKTKREFSGRLVESGLVEVKL